MAACLLDASESQSGFFQSKASKNQRRPMLDSNKSPDFLAASGSSPPVLTTSILNAALEYAHLEAVHCPG